LTVHLSICWCRKQTSGNASDDWLAMYHDTTTIVELNFGQWFCHFNFKSLERL